MKVCWLSFKQATREKSETEIYYRLALGNCQKPADDEGMLALQHMCDDGGHSYDAFSLSVFQGSCRQLSSTSFGNKLFVGQTQSYLEAFLMVRFFFI